MKVGRWGFWWKRRCEEEDRRGLGQIMCVRETIRVQQNWMAARGLMSMMGAKTRLENIKG